MRNLVSIDWIALYLPLFVRPSVRMVTFLLHQFYLFLPLTGCMCEIFLYLFFPFECDSLILISLRCKVTEIFHYCLLDLNFSHIQNSTWYVILVECLLVLKLFTYLIVTLRIPLTHFILVECPLGGVIYCCRRGPTHKGLSNPLMQN